jgi:addiction module RelE/StbE family toxin
MKLFWSKRFLRDFKSLIRQNVQIRSAVEKTLQKLAQDCFDPSLKTHKLKGDLEGCWSCSIDYSNRIIFEFVKDPDTEQKAINLLTLGSHDDVY